MSGFSNFPSSVYFGMPFGGPVIQDIDPQTRWFSPYNIEIKTSHAQVEREIIRDVAGYGQQLGILSDALEELAKLTGHDKAKGLAEFRKLLADVRAKKSEVREDARDHAKKALDYLKESSPEDLEILVKSYQK